MARVGAQVERPSTPTYAGLTTAVQRWSGFSRLYPRMRGADMKQIARDTEKTPLPPHARG